MFGTIFTWLKPKKSRIHLDYASTTPVHQNVMNVMRPYFSELWANPGALYEEVVKAREAVFHARSRLARTLRVRASDITFTSGGTESNNLAILGLINALHNAGRSYESMKILTTAIEHPSILETLEVCKLLGVEIAYIPVDADGLIEMQDFKGLLSEKVVLVTVGYVNSEIGTIQDIKKISRIVRIWNEEHQVAILVHLDASQAPLWLTCALDSLGVHMMTLDAGKCYGPKGVGVLVHRHGIKLTPLLHGGGQENGLRSGTENVPLIVGGVEAVVRAQEGIASRIARSIPLRDFAIEYILATFPTAILNGHAHERVANNINISIPGLDTEYGVVYLDQKGIAVATRSACGAKETTGSHVVRSIGGDNDRAISTIRITLGEDSTRAHINELVRVLKEFTLLIKDYGSRVS